MNWSGYIILTVLYLAAFSLLRQKPKKAESAIPNPSYLPNIISFPRNYTINIIESDSADVDYRDFADITLNISDIIKQQDSPSLAVPVSDKSVLKFENIDFSEFINIVIS